MRVLHGDLDERAHLDGAAEAHRRKPLRELQCVVQVGRVDHVAMASGGVDPLLSIVVALILAGILGVARRISSPPGSAMLA